jgi:hypothetical protein
MRTENLIPFEPVQFIKRGPLRKKSSLIAVRSFLQRLHLNEDFFQKGTSFYELNRFKRN